MFESAQRLWVIHIGNDHDVAALAQRDGFICIGWTRIGDLSPFDTPEKLKAAYERAFPSKSAASVRSSYMQVFRFAHEMQVGDPVVYPIKGSQYILVGRIAGPYEWSSNGFLRDRDYCNIRSVEWLAKAPRLKFSQQALRSFGSYSSITRADDYLDDVCAAIDSAQSATDEPQHVDTEAAESEEDAVDAASEVIQATKDYLMRNWSRTAQQFEEVVAGVFRALGYTATVQQGTRDLGVDVIAHADPLGVTPPVLKIQAKSGTSTVGAREVKQLRGVLNSGEKGVLIGLGGFSVDARHTEQNDANLILIDGDRFIELFLGSYEQLSPEIRHRFPLQQVYVAAP